MVVLKDSKDVDVWVQFYSAALSGAMTRGETFSDLAAVAAVAAEAADMAMTHLRARQEDAT